MDRLTIYRKYIQDVINEYSIYKPAYGEVEIEAVIDLSSDHYEVITIGWNHDQRIHGWILHIDIKNEKIWIQHDGTEEGIANRLVDVGIPKEDIVLAFHAPSKRKFTKFAVE